MQFVDQIHQPFRLLANQLLFHFVTYLRHKSDQHLQHLPRQIWLHRRLAQRQLPVERLVMVDYRLCGRYRRRGDAVYSGLIAQQQGVQFLFFDRLRQIVVHAGAQELLALALQGVCGDGDNRR